MQYMKIFYCKDVQFSCSYENSNEILMFLPKFTLKKNKILLIHRKVSDWTSSMASSIRYGTQMPITCDLWDEAVQQFCNTCQVNLCVDCISKHVDTLKFQSHDIVHFKSRNIPLVSIQCRGHPGQKCEAYCRQCQIPDCIKCLIGPHKGHDVEELSFLLRTGNLKLTAEQGGMILNSFQSTIPILETIQSKSK